MRRTFALVLAAFLFAPPARAAGQVWTGIESRVVVSEGKSVLPTHIRWVNESRFGGPRDGLAFLLLRVGPMWELDRNVLLNVNATQLLEADRAGVLRPETRFELEPNLRGRLGPLTTNLRQRAEFRVRRSELDYRYRVQLRVNYQPQGARLAPYVSSEIFLLTRARVGEMRNALGLSFSVSTHLRFDLAYVHRPRQVAGELEHDHIALFTVAFTPQLAPIVDSSGF